MIEHEPKLREIAHDVPHTSPTKTFFFDQLQLCIDAPGILKMNNMLNRFAILPHEITKIGGLRCRIKFRLQDNGILQMYVEYNDAIYVYCIEERN